MKPLDVSPLFFKTWGKRTHSGVNRLSKMDISLLPRDLRLPKAPGARRAPGTGRTAYAKITVPVIEDHGVKDVVLMKIL
jgi:hypothetical protein